MKNYHMSITHLAQLLCVWLHPFKNVSIEKYPMQKIRQIISKQLNKLSSQSRHKQVNKCNITNTQETLSCSLPISTQQLFLVPQVLILMMDLLASNTTD